MFGYSTTPSHFQQVHPHPRHHRHSHQPTKVSFEDILAAMNATSPRSPSSSSPAPSMPAFILDFLSSSAAPQREERTLNLPCGIQSHHHQYEATPQFYARSATPSAATPAVSSLSELKKQYEAYQAFDAQRRAKELQELEEKQALRRAEEERLFIAKLQAAAREHARAQAEMEARAREEARLIALAKAKAEAEAREREEAQARLRAAYIARLQAQKEQEERARIQREKARAAAIIAARRQAEQEEQEQKRKQGALFFAQFLDQLRRQAQLQENAVEVQQKAAQQVENDDKSIAEEKAAAQRLVDEWKREHAQAASPAPVQKKAEEKSKPSTQEKQKQRASESEVKQVKEQKKREDTENEKKNEVSPEDILKSFFAQFGIHVVPPTSSPFTQSDTPSAAGPSNSSKASATKSEKPSSPASVKKGEPSKKSPQVSKAASPARPSTAAPASTSKALKQAPSSQSQKKGATPASSTAATAAPSKKVSNLVEKALQTALENEWNETAIVNSLKTLDGIRKRFEALRSSFVEPETLVFEATENDNTSIPPLAFASANRSIKEYDETLLRILTQVDSVESHDSENVKRNRKELAVAIQKELDRIDAIKNKVWAKIVAEKSVDKAEEVEKSSEETETVPASDEVDQAEEEEAPAEAEKEEGFTQVDTPAATSTEPTTESTELGGTAEKVDGIEPAAATSTEDSTTSVEANIHQEETGDVSAAPSVDESAPAVVEDSSATTSSNATTETDITPEDHTNNVDTSSIANSSNVEAATSAAVNIQITSDSETASTNIADDQSTTTKPSNQVVQSELAKAEQDKPTVEHQDSLSDATLSGPVEEASPSLQDHVATTEKDDNADDASVTSGEGNVELAQSATLPKKAGEDNHAIVEIESVSSNPSEDGESQEESATMLEQLELRPDSQARNRDKSTTVSDEEDDEGQNSSASSEFELL